MRIFEKLFGVKKREKPASYPEPKIPERDRPMLMTSQYPALYLAENNPFYLDAYLRILAGLGVNSSDGEKLFDFECDVIRKHPKPYLLDPQFVKRSFIDLEQPFLRQYPKTKEDIKKEKFFTVSEICKFLDEAEWHFWNSHERDLPEEIWEEIFQWRIQGEGGVYGEEYLMMVVKESDIAVSSLLALSNAQGRHLNKYKWS